MSAQEPVIAVSNETTESDRVDFSTLPPPEHTAVKDVSPTVDSSPAEPVTGLPTESTQATSNDTMFIPPKHDTNIPDSTPTNPNGSVSGSGPTPYVSVVTLNL